VANNGVTVVLRPRGLAHRGTVRTAASKPITRRGGASSQGEMIYDQRHGTLNIWLQHFRIGPKCLIVLHDGAYLVAAACSFSRQFANVAVVEETTRGSIRLEENLSLSQFAKQIAPCLFSENKQVPMPKDIREPQLLAHAVDQILHRIRLLAREMCPEDRAKLEIVLRGRFRICRRLRRWREGREQGSVPADASTPLSHPHQLPFVAFCFRDDCAALKNHAERWVRVALSRFG
jgi:hypothetical protein